MHQPGISSDGRSSSSHLSSGDPARAAASPLQGFGIAPGVLGGTLAGDDGGGSAVRRRKRDTGGAARGGGVEIDTDRAALLGDLPASSSPRAFPAGDACVGGAGGTGGGSRGGGKARSRSPPFVDDGEEGIAEGGRSPRARSILSTSGGRTAARERSFQGCPVGGGGLGEETGRGGASAINDSFANSSSAVSTIASVGHDRIGLADERCAIRRASDLAGGRGGSSGSSGRSVGESTSQGWLSGGVRHTGGRSTGLRATPTMSTGGAADAGRILSRGGGEEGLSGGGAQRQRYPRPQGGGVSGWMSPVTPSGGGLSGRSTGPPWASSHVATAGTGMGAGIGHGSWASSGEHERVAAGWRPHSAEVGSSEDDDDDGQDIDSSRGLGRKGGGLGRMGHGHVDGSGDFGAGGDCDEGEDREGSSSRGVPAGRARRSLAPSRVRDLEGSSEGGEEEEEEEEEDEEEEEEGGYNEEGIIDPADDDTDQSAWDEGESSSLEEEEEERREEEEKEEKEEEEEKEGTGEAEEGKTQAALALGGNERPETGETPEIHTAHDGGADPAHGGRDTAGKHGAAPAATVAVEQSEMAEPEISLPEVETKDWSNQADEAPVEEDNVHAETEEAAAVLETVEPKEAETATGIEIDGDTAGIEEGEEKQDEHRCGDCAAVSAEASTAVHAPSAAADDAAAPPIARDQHPLRDAREEARDVDADRVVGGAADGHDVAQSPARKAPPRVGTPLSPSRSRGPRRSTRNSPRKSAAENGAVSSTPRASDHGRGSGLVSGGDNGEDVGDSGAAPAAAVGVYFPGRIEAEGEKADRDSDDPSGQTAASEGPALEPSPAPPQSDPPAVLAAPSDVVPPLPPTPSPIASATPADDEGGGSASSAPGQPPPSAATAAGTPLGSQANTTTSCKDVEQGPTDLPSPEAIPGSDAAHTVGNGAEGEKETGSSNGTQRAAASAPASPAEEAEVERPTTGGSVVVQLRDGGVWDPFAGDKNHRVAVWDRKGRRMIGGLSAPLRRELRDFLKNERYEVRYIIVSGGGGVMGSLAHLHAINTGPCAAVHTFTAFSARAIAVSTQQLLL